MGGPECFSGLSADESEAWMALLALMEVLPAALDAQLRRDSGLTRFEFYVLAMLSDGGGAARPMTDLATVTNGSLSRLSHAVAKLEQQALVRRFPRETDRRTTLVELTDDGRALLGEAAPAHLGALRRIVFDAIPPGRLQELTELLRPVVHGLVGGADCTAEAPAA